MNRQIVVIAHNIRSLHNVGSIFRTAECLGASKLFLSGYTPYPEMPGDKRLPHVRRRNSSQIAKTALGTENELEWEQEEDVGKIIEQLQDRGFTITALEQSKNSKKLNKYNPPEKVALIIGNEPEGIDKETLKLCDDIVEIPMKGKKESLNVVQAFAITLYSLQEA